MKTIEQKVEEIIAKVLPCTCGKYPCPQHDAILEVEVEVEDDE